MRWSSVGCCYAMQFACMKVAPTRLLTAFAREELGRSQILLNFRRRQADFDECRRYGAREMWKHAMWDAGCKLPTQMADGSSRCWGRHQHCGCRAPHLRDAHGGTRERMKPPIYPGPTGGTDALRYLHRARMFRAAALQLPDYSNAEQFWPKYALLTHAIELALKALAFHSIASGKTSCKEPKHMAQCPKLSPRLN